MSVTKALMICSGYIEKQSKAKIVYADYQNNRLK